MHTEAKKGTSSLLVVRQLAPTLLQCHLTLLTVLIHLVIVGTPKECKNRRRCKVEQRIKPTFNMLVHKQV